MASYYPHKETVLITIISLLVVGGAFIYVQGGVFSEKSAVNAPAKVAVTPLARDISDEIPLNDWRTSFFANESAPTKLVQSPTKKVPTENLTLTDTFSRDFFARYIQLKQDNLLNNQQLVTGVIDQSIDTAIKNATQPKTYTTSDITTTSDTSPSSLKTYGNAVGRVLAEYGVDGDPATIANAAFDKGDMTMLTGIDPFIISYKKIVSALLGISAPQPLAADHVALINGISGMQYIAENLRAIEKDPMRGMVALNSYTTTQGRIVTALKEMKNYFGTMKIAFASAEPGALFSLTF